MNNMLIEKDIFYKLQYKDYRNFLKVNDTISEIKDTNISMANQAFKNIELCSLDLVPLYQCYCRVQILKE